MLAADYLTCTLLFGAVLEGKIAGGNSPTKWRRRTRRVVTAKGIEWGVWNLGSLGSVVNSPSVVRDGALAENVFCVF